jgi:FkbM family methyltransferase
MRTEDLRDYLRLRQLTLNAWEIVRFRKRKRPGTVLRVRLRDGRSFELRGGQQDFHIFHRIFMRDEYALRPHGGRAWGCVVDLGANVGLFAIRASELAKRVICYEPFPGNLEQLRRNTADWPAVEVVGQAVAGEAGVLRLYRPRGAGMSGVHTLHAEESHASAEYDEVPATTLDAIFERHGVEHCELLKIDVEGAEYDILGAASGGTFARIERIYGEYHDVRPEDPATRIGSLKRLLVERDFRVRVVPKVGKDNLGMFYAERR